MSNRKEGRNRRIVQLRDAGYTHEEVATRLGITKQRVQQNLSP